jgi:hypothetical protein
LDATVIFQRDEDAQPPFLTVYQVMRGGLNGVSLILDRLFQLAQFFLCGNGRSPEKRQPVRERFHPVP